MFEEVVDLALDIAGPKEVICTPKEAGSLGSRARLSIRRVYVVIAFGCLVDHTPDAGAGGSTPIDGTTVIRVVMRYIDNTGADLRHVSTLTHKKGKSYRLLGFTPIGTTSLAPIDSVSFLCQLHSTA